MRLLMMMMLLQRHLQLLGACGSGGGSLEKQGEAGIQRQTVTSTAATVGAAPRHSTTAATGGGRSGDAPVGCRS